MAEKFGPIGRFVVLPGSTSRTIPVDGDPIVTQWTVMVDPTSGTMLNGVSGSDHCFLVVDGLDGDLRITMEIHDAAVEISRQLEQLDLESSERAHRWAEEKYGL